MLEDDQTIDLECLAALETIGLTSPLLTFAHYANRIVVQEYARKVKRFGGICPQRLPLPLLLQHPRMMRVAAVAAAPAAPARLLLFARGCAVLQEILDRRPWRATQVHVRHAQFRHRPQRLARRLARDCRRVAAPPSAHRGELRHLEELQRFAE